jgi:hypothetical protein
MLNNSEFAFHVHRKAGDAKRPALFSIGVWEGKILRAICHTQPIDDALAAIRRVLEEPERPAVLQDLCRRFCDKANS